MNTHFKRKPIYTLPKHNKQRGRNNETKYISFQHTLTYFTYLFIYLFIHTTPTFYCLNIINNAGETKKQNIFHFKHTLTYFTYLFIYSFTQLQLSIA